MTSGLLRSLKFRAPGGTISPDSPTKDGIKHAFPTSSTIQSQVSLANIDGYNPEFPFLEGLAPSRQMVSFDYSSSEEASSAGEDHQREVFILPSGDDHSRGKTEDAPRRSHITTPRGNDKNTSGDEQGQHSDERVENPRGNRTSLSQTQGSDVNYPETTRQRRIVA